MALREDIIGLDNVIDKTKINRFISLVKGSYNFVVYDIPFYEAVTNASDIVYSADNIVLNIAANNWGVMKAIIQMCNIESSDMQDVLFSRAEILFNRFSANYRILEKKINKANDILKAMDEEVYRLIGDDPGSYFKDLYICGILDEDIEMENSWFNDKAYSDSKKGSKIFLDLLERIILQK